MRSPAHKSAQDAPTQAGLHFSHSTRMSVADRVENGPWRYGLGSGFGRSRNFLKHPIDHAHMEVHNMVRSD